MLGRRKTKPLKWKEHKTESDKLDPNKIKGLVNTKHENYESNFSNSAAIWSHWATEGSQIQWCSWGGVKSWTKRGHDDKDGFTFQSITRNKHFQSPFLALIFFPSNMLLTFFFYKLRPVHGLDGMVMSHNNDRSDGCTRRHMSVLCSSNVRLKLMLCVNKDDRKWQFGSSNQECHSQLRPLPASDTSHSQRGHGFDSSFSLSLFFYPLSSWFLQDFPFQCHLCAKLNRQGEDSMMYGKRKPEWRWHIFWTLQ